jgi:hypothetical protein
MESESLSFFAAAFLPIMLTLDSQRAKRRQGIPGRLSNTARGIGAEEWVTVRPAAVSSGKQCSMSTLPRRPIDGDGFIE